MHLFQIYYVMTYTIPNCHLIYIIYGIIHFIASAIHKSNIFYHLCTTFIMTNTSKLWYGILTQKDDQNTIEISLKLEKCLLYQPNFLILFLAASPTHSLLIPSHFIPPSSSTSPFPCSMSSSSSSLICSSSASSGMVVMSLFGLQTSPLHIYVKS